MTDTNLFRAASLERRALAATALYIGIVAERVTNAPCNELHWRHTADRAASAERCFLEALQYVVMSERPRLYP